MDLLIQSVFYRFVVDSIGLIERDFEYVYFRIDWERSMFYSLFNK